VTIPRLLFVGTGAMARAHAERFAMMPGCTLAGAVDTNPERARDFAEGYGIACAFDSAAAALDWGGFDAVVNATPDGAHKATTLPFLAAGKPVLCEKPLAPNHADALAMAEAAEAVGAINMVNLTYRNAAALQMARHMIATGGIGEVRHVQASYLQSWLTGRHWGDWRTEERWLWRLSSAHGSKGVLGDIGVHILDFVSYATGLDFVALHARLRTFDKADGGAIGAYTLDVNDSVAMSVEFGNGALGVIHMSRYATGKKNDLDLIVHGESGALKVWATTTDSTLEACLGADIETQTWAPVDCPATPRNEERFLIALLSGENGDPSFRHAAGIQKLIDLAFASDAEGRLLPVR